ncbi:uncharacterized protein FOMMEDRAFT_25218 [Fomitiporia mediterranea MF3/22]|uniref:uncharacterized protein n=1 Tax=Fomitiporia mediterranea (strain MF3/22) TaxID=694068 RepID=UPI00044098AB|nr:uncharacterized protein FOMMEDRAFT_25218 [Fomitiporia mediterranea MF3/22]EJD08003.1 hypothetical protein FOMMEDRAFT_25218 [Fomitiporia mediterranea MF3/22]
MWKQTHRFDSLSAIKLGADLSKEFCNKWRKKNFSLIVIPSDGQCKRVVHKGIKKKTKKCEGQAVYTVKVILKTHRFDSTERTKEEIVKVVKKMNYYSTLENSIAYFLITEQLCEGVRYLHKEYSSIHFDLKPENLFITVRSKLVYLSQKEVLVIGNLGYLTKKDSARIPIGLLSSKVHTFIKLCLKLAEEERASIEELLGLPWLSNIKTYIRENFQVKDTWINVKDKIVTRQTKEKYKEQYGSIQDNNSQVSESRQNIKKEKRSSILSDKYY